MVLIDLIICGAYITDPTYIHRAIKSAPIYPYKNRIIIFDGCNGVDPAGYEAYKQEVIKTYSGIFNLFVEYDNNLYFKEALYRQLKESTSTHAFVIQDDVRSPKIDLKRMMEKAPLDFGIISFPHKPIKQVGTHWFEPLESVSKPFYKSHGWSERVFLCNIPAIINACDSHRKPTKFIDTIYHQKRKIKGWNKIKSDYWNLWKVYITNNHIHEHLVGKRKKK